MVVDPWRKLFLEYLGMTILYLALFLTLPSCVTTRLLEVTTLIQRPSVKCFISAPTMVKAASPNSPSSVLTGQSSTKR